MGRSSKRKFFQYLVDVSGLDHSRIAWIDYAKGIAIIMIVFRHVNTGLWGAGIPLDPVFFDASVQIGVTFRMPLYFMLSGIFFHRSLEKRRAAGYAKHKFNTILYPYLVWSVIFMTIQMLLGDYVNADFSSISDYLLILYDPWGHWWFLYVLFCVSILYMFLYKIARQPWIIAICLLFHAVSILIGDVFLLDDTLRLIIFFGFGQLASFVVYSEKTFIWLSRWYVVIPILLTAIGGEYLLFTYLRNDPLANLFFAFTGITAASVLCYRLSFFESYFLRILRLIGQYSLYIYLLHALTSAAIRVLLTKIFNVQNILMLEVSGFIMGVLGPILLYRTLVYIGANFLFTPGFTPKYTE